MSYTSNDIVLFLTATVTPQFNFMKISSPQQRREQYLNSIKWYLKNTQYPIVICENSGCHDFEDEINILLKKTNIGGGRIEYICYAETNQSRNVGYNELMIFEKAHTESKILKRAKLICKITGRLIVENIEQHLSQAKRQKGMFLAGDIAFTKAYDYLDTRFFIFPNAMWYNLLSVKPITGAVSHAEFDKKGKQIGVFPSIETALGNMLYENAMARKVKSVFLTFPVFFIGIAGHSGEIYNKTAFEKTKLTIIHFVKVLRFKYRLFTLLYLQ